MGQSRPLATAAPCRALSDESFETLAVERVVQIQKSAAFADRHFGQQRADFLEPRRVDSENVGAVGCQEACAHRAGNNTRDVENPDPRQWARGGVAER